MKWEKNVTDSLDLQQALLLVFVFVLVIVSIIKNQQAILLPAGFLLIWHLGILFLNKYYGKKLEIENVEKSIRLFEGETNELIIKLKNNSYIPYLNGALTFSTSPKIENEEYIFTKTSYKHTYRIPIFIVGKSELVISFPFKAKRRGTLRIEDIQLQFPHLLNFNNVNLRLQERFKQEVIIYPKLEPVGGFTNFPYIKLGNQFSRFSPFEDPLKLLGTRDYQSSDPFNRIHWKASAKSQKFQTKILERNHHVSWAIVINIAQKSRLGNLYISTNLERYLSQAAFLSQTIIKQGYPIEIYINFKGLGARPYFLEQGEGFNYLKNILEFFARIQESETPMKESSFLKWTDKKMKDANLIAVIGEIGEDSAFIFNKWEREGRKVFSLEVGNDISYLKEIKNERALPYVK